MRIGILGLGGIGGYFGTKLAGRYSQEHEIIFVQRGGHLKAIKTEGLRYITRDHQYLVHPTLATDDPTDAGRLDLAIVCVKSYSLDKALEVLASALHSESVMLTVQNGIDIAERCQRKLPQATVLPGAIFLSAHIAEPGVVRQVGGAGKFFFGPLGGDVERYRWIETLLLGAGIKAVLDPDIRARIWEKYLFVEPLATLTAATGLSIGQAVRDPAGRQQFVNLMEEILALALAHGVDLAESLIDENLALAERIPTETRTSMQQDLEKGRRAEMDVFTEFVLKDAEVHRISVPVHQKLCARIIKPKADRDPRPCRYR